MLPPTEEFLHFANEMADAARRITLAHFRTPLEIAVKKDHSPVTNADKETEHALRAMITARYPEHAIIGEEEGITGDSDWQWIIDPIDGTKSFMSGFPVYCTLIALLYQGQPLLNIIDMPKLDERFTATHEQATLCNGKPIHARKTTALANAICYSSEPGMFTAEETQQLAPLRAQIALQNYGGDGYLYAMLSSGWIDLVVESDMKPHDYLPLILIVEQSGGCISDWQGKPLTLESKGQVLAAATPALQQLALAAIAHA